MIKQQTWSVSQDVQRIPAAAAQVTTDEALIGRIATGDKLAMQVLFARHHVRVFRFVLGLVKDRTIAEDLISDVFLDVWRQSDRFEGRAAVATWLLSIARYKALSALRSRRVHQPLDEALTVEDQTDGPEASMQAKDRGAIMARCMAALSREHREIIDLAYYHEKSTDEIAEIVGIPVATVKTRMFYARKQLRDMLSAAGVESAS